LSTAIPALLLVGIAALWWLAAVNARDRACQVAGRFCKANGWQLLDQTVALRRLRPARTPLGWNLLRHYRFEFSPDGGRRMGGEVQFAGTRALRILAETDEGQVIQDLLRRPRSPGTG